MSKKSWHRVLEPLWESEKKVAFELLKDCRKGETRAGLIFFRGLFSVHIHGGSSYGPFNLKIVYPRRFLLVPGAPDFFLLNNPYRWKNTTDSHIEKDWRLCLGVPSEYEIDFRDPDSLEKLLQKVAAFLLLQVQYQKDLVVEGAGGPKARWPGNDRKHGVLGIAQAAKGWTVARDGNRPCPCWKGARFKKCCGPRLVIGGMI